MEAVLKLYSVLVIEREHSIYNNCLFSNYRIEDDSKEQVGSMTYRSSTTSCVPAEPEPVNPIYAGKLNPFSQC